VSAAAAEDLVGTGEKIVVEAAALVSSAAAAEICLTGVAAE